MCFIFFLLVESKNIQLRFESMAIENNLELLREENSNVSKDEGESSTRVTSGLKAEKETDENKHTAGDSNMESDSALHSGKSDGFVFKSIKETSKKEQKALLKTEDTIKMTYTAFTCHNKSAYDTAIFDMKSTSTEISGVSSDEMKTNSSKAHTFQENIRINRLNIGDTPPRREIEQRQQNIQDSTLYSNDTYAHPNVDLNRHEKETDSEPEGHSGQDSTDEYNNQVKTNKNIFSFGKKMMQNFLKWTFEDYEIASANNYLHNLSKRLTK